MDKHLHIICLTVPYPVDYGGVFDLYYKLPALQQQGVKIHLHCFEYGRGQQPILEQYCEEVFYYPRRKGLAGVSISVPYIVSSRRSKALRERLLKDDYPILMEGVHCTWLLNDPGFSSRRCFVRLHNVEHIYYKHLSEYTSSPLKKAYYKIESTLLKKYERRIASKAAFLAVSHHDAEVYKTLGANRISYLPLFLPQWQVSCREGMGKYCLYQGDLSTAENEKAVVWLVKEVFNDLQVELIVAGKNPSERLVQLIQSFKNGRLVANPNSEEMQRLIANAQVNIVPSFNATGIKLKLVNALYNGRHCIVNTSAAKGTGLEDLCHIVDGERETKAMIKALMSKPFSSQERELRRSILSKLFDNETSAAELVQIIWGHSS